MKFVIVLLFCLISACTKSEIPNAHTLSVALSAAPATLDPRRATDATGQRISSLMFSSLVRTGSDLRLTGDAAESWTYKDLVYTFKIRPGLKFANGRDLTELDILYSFEVFRKPDSPFQSTLAPVKSVAVETVDGVMYVKLALEKFHAPLLDDLSAIKLLPKAEIEKDEAAFTRAPFGTGSFTLNSQDSQQIVLVARVGHTVAIPKIRNVVFKIIQDDSTRLLKTLKGAIDIAQQELPLNVISQVEKDGNFNIIRYPGLSMNYVLVNFKNAELRKPALRRAMAHALNRQEIIQYKLNGLAREATSLITPVHPMFIEELKAPAFDPEKAKTLFKEAGAPAAELTLKTSNNPAAVENGRVIAHQLGQIGLKVKLQSYEWSTFYGDVKSGNFELALMRWVGTTDPDLYRLAFHSSEVPPGRNRGSYVNKALDKLLEEGPTIVDAMKRREHYRKIQTMVLEDLAVLPLWYDTQVAVIHKRVKDYDPPTNGDYTGLLKAWK
ncbi:MAG TPA: ABC transporter substrate-binding protein [Bdellovibrionales bacterium]|nr:ABC transporter substrate-binding protein [Bdellovibrionales bacterium]